MNVVKCINGHFFDSDTYEKCPQCGECVVGQKADSKPQKPEKSGFWGRKKNKQADSNKENGISSSSSMKEPSKEKAEQQGYASPVSANASNNQVVGASGFFDNGQANPYGNITGDSKTLDFWQVSGTGAIDNTSGNDSKYDDKTESIFDDSKPSSLSPSQPKYFADSQSGSVYPNSSSFIPQSQSNYVAPSQPNYFVDKEPVSVPQSSLREAIQKASASDEGKTMSYFSAVTAATDEEKQQKQQKHCEPVVGWLVCIAGKHFGEAFDIYSGKNSIGRTCENRIVIDGDNSISRNKHAFIIYEPKKRDFYIQPGDSSGLTYLNEEYITDSRKLSAKDVVELGETKMLFVPLCSNEFSWEGYMTKEDCNI